MSAPIKADDSPLDRVTKLLPADITAAFISVKEALAAYFNDPYARAAPIFWTFVAILLLSILYFRYYSRITNALHIIFLCLSFVVFAMALASADFVNFFLSHNFPEQLTQSIKVASVVLPILWAFLISNIFVGISGKKVESTQG